MSEYKSPTEIAILDSKTKDSPTPDLAPKAGGTLLMLGPPFILTWCPLLPPPPTWCPL